MNIKAVITRNKHGQPEVEICKELFAKALQPSNLRYVGQQLIALSDMAGSVPLAGKHWRPTSITIECESKAPSLANWLTCQCNTKDEAAA